MKFVKLSLVLASLSGLAACGDQVVPADKSYDLGFGQGDVSKLIAGIWVDPNGCDHWIIDDGVEGYLSERLTPDGRPVCSGVAQPTQAVGPFKAGGDIEDPVRADNFRPSGRPLPRIE